MADGNDTRLPERSVRVVENPYKKKSLVHSILENQTAQSGRTAHVVDSFMSSSVESGSKSSRQECGNHNFVQSLVSPEKIDEPAVLQRREESELGYLSPRHGRARSWEESGAVDVTFLSQDPGVENSQGNKNVPLYPVVESKIPDGIQIKELDVEFPSALKAPLSDPHHAWNRNLTVVSPEEGEEGKKESGSQKKSPAENLVSIHCPLSEGNETTSPSVLDQPCHGPTVQVNDENVGFAKGAKSHSDENVTTTNKRKRKDPVGHSLGSEMLITKNNLKAFRIPNRIPEVREDGKSYVCVHWEGSKRESWILEEDIAIKVILGDSNGRLSRRKRPPQLDVPIVNERSKPATFIDASSSISANTDDDTLSYQMTPPGMKSGEVDPNAPVETLEDERKIPAIAREVQIDSDSVPTLGGSDSVSTRRGRKSKYSYDFMGNLIPPMRDVDQITREVILRKQRQNQTRCFQMELETLIPCVLSEFGLPPDDRRGIVPIVENMIFRCAYKMAKRCGDKNAC